jgi:hypothetical protein
MSLIIQVLATYAPWIYAACGLVALYQIYRIMLVRSERRQAVFSLEREKAIRDLYRIFSVALILLMIMGATYFFSTTLSSAVEPLVVEALEPTPNLPFVPTPTNTPLPATPTPEATPTREATPVPTPQEEVVEAVPTAPARTVAQVPACPDNRALLIRPGNNETVSGVISVVGSASHDQFQYYKVEYAPGVNADSNFGYLVGGNAPVVNGVLGNVDTNTLGNGSWTLRLIVVDQTGNFPPPCKVTINVQN